MIEGEGAIESAIECRMMIVVVAERKLESIELIVTKLLKWRPRRKCGTRRSFVQDPRKGLLIHLAGGCRRHAFFPAGTTFPQSYRGTNFEISNLARPTQDRRRSIQPACWCNVELAKQVGAATIDGCAPLSAVAFLHYCAA